MFHQLIQNLWAFEGCLLVAAIFAGFIGSLLGLGGGIIVTPVMTLAFGINIRYAIGASLVSVIATSSGAAATYVRDRLTNLRLAIMLEVATTMGAILGVTVSVLLPARALFVIYAVVLTHSAIVMLRKRSQTLATEQEAHPIATKLRLHSSYPDAHLGQEVDYYVAGVPQGFAVMLLAGMISALLGIGSGILKVVAMDNAMKLPIKVSSATSNFMIGVTAAASAGAYYMRGDIRPELAAPVALGVLAGALLGARVLVHLSAQKIRRLFVVVIVAVAVQMGLKGLGVI